MKLSQLWVLDVNNLFLYTPAKQSRCYAKMCIWIDKVDVDFPQKGRKLNTVVVSLLFAYSISRILISFSNHKWIIQLSLQLSGWWIFSSLNVTYYSTKIAV